MLLVHVLCAKHFPDIFEAYWDIETFLNLKKDLIDFTVWVLALQFGNLEVKERAILVGCMWEVALQELHYLHFNVLEFLLIALNIWIDIAESLQLINFVLDNVDIERPNSLHNGFWMQLKLLIDFGFGVLARVTLK
jgi:hypothetical protein